VILNSNNINSIKKDSESEEFAEFSESKGADHCLSLGFEHHFF